jgi:hypothetical protein
MCGTPVETLKERHGIERIPPVVEFVIEQTSILRIHEADDIALLHFRARLLKRFRNVSVVRFKPAGMTLGFVLLHRRLELVTGELLQHLREDAAYSIHGGSSVRLTFGS